MANTVDKVIKVASNEVGYLEKKTNSQLDSKTANAGKNNYTKYARDLDAIANFYNGKKQGYAWCDMFFDWCFVKAYGVETAKKMLCQPDKSYGAGCGMSAQYYKNVKQFHTKNPRVGDQIFFWDKAKSRVAHTGIVYHVDDNYVYTIEGNTSGASGVVANGGGVCRKQYSLNYSRIYGYGRPNYSCVSNGTLKAPLKITQSKKDIQKFLNEYYGYEISDVLGGLLDVDGDIGTKSKKALAVAFQVELNRLGAGLSVDGSFGGNTAKAFTKYVGTLAKGDKNSIFVTLWQCVAVGFGYDPNGIDGSFGNGCTTATNKLFAAKGIKKDSSVSGADINILL